MMSVATKTGARCIGFEIDDEAFEAAEKNLREVDKEVAEKIQIRHEDVLVVNQQWFCSSLRNGKVHPKIILNTILHYILSATINCTISCP